MNELVHGIVAGLCLIWALSANLLIIDPDYQKHRKRISALVILLVFCAVGMLITV
jgi:hypothetical protein